MDVDQIAHFLNVSRNTVKNWKVPSVRVGNRVLYDPDAVRRWVNSENGLSRLQERIEGLLQKYEQGEV